MLMLCHRCVCIWETLITANSEERKSVMFGLSYMDWNLIYLKASLHLFINRFQPLRLEPEYL